ncbi:MAG TPA: hypothetical protein VN688_33440 [Gemmataceae bacterium]|nr:hypothetical protein [Gemmataceae bacterium]
MERPKDDVWQKAVHQCRSAALEAAEHAANAAIGISDDDDDEDDDATDDEIANGQTAKIYKQTFERVYEEFCIANFEDFYLDACRNAGPAYQAGNGEETVEEEPGVMRTDEELWEIFSELLGDDESGAKSLNPGELQRLKQLALRLKSESDQAAAKYLNSDRECKHYELRGLPGQTIVVFK